MDPTPKPSTLWPPWRPQRPKSAPPNPQTDSETGGPLPHQEPASAAASTSDLPGTKSEKLKNLHAQTLHSVAGISRPLFPSWSSKLLDKRSGIIGDDALCQQCLQFPIAAFRSGESQLGKKPWTTSLERLLQQRDWCPLCRLLLHMLSRPHNDPLKHEKLAHHVPGAIHGLSLSELAAKHDWPFIDKHWPFGRTAIRRKDLAFSTNDLKSGAEDIARGPGVYWGVKFGAEKARGAIPGATNGVVSNETFIEVATTPLEYQAQKMAFENHQEVRKTRYRKECSLVVTPHLTSNSTKHLSGHLTVECLAYIEDSQTKPTSLGKFHLRFADDQQSPSYPHGAVSYGQRVDPKWIELRIAGQWLSECLRKHGDKCHTHGWEAARKIPEHLRVIDVEELCIVEPDSPSDHYVALSYIWGNKDDLLGKLFLTENNQAALQKPGGLKDSLSKIPRAIVDAMEVVKAIGQRYLWVDSLCIVQPAKESELCQMDRIYGGALLTLVAASGEKADDGIAGVRNNILAPDNVKVERNLRQESARLEGAHIIASLDNHNNLETTSWNQRGWTFQERLLSRRLLVFAHDEMVWYCRCMTCREDMDPGFEGQLHPPHFLTLNPEWFDGHVADPKELPADALLNAGTKLEKRRWADGCLETDRFGRTHLVRSKRLSEYINSVEDYTKRNLTVTCDIESAFRGLGSIFERSFKTRLVHGLLESVLDVTLLWRPRVPLTRRKCSCERKSKCHFPSWSWVGWEGAVEYASPFHMDRDDDGVIKNYGTAPLGEEGIRPLLRYHTWLPEKRRGVPANFTGRGFPHPKKGFPEGWQRSFPEGRDKAPGESQTPSRPVPEGSKYLDLLKPYHLMFSTKSLKSFRLGPPAENVGLYAVGASIAEGPRHMTVQDGRGITIGALTLDKSGPPPASLSQYELIVLAEAHSLKEAPNEAQDPKEYTVDELKDYLVMLVMRTGCHEINESRGLGQVGRGNLEIYERRGLGQIGKHSFEKGNPEIKTIILG